MPVFQAKMFASLTYSKVGIGRAYSDEHIYIWGLTNNETVLLNFILNSSGLLQS
jgi:hypothetical protein